MYRYAMQGICYNLYPGHKTALADPTPYVQLSNYLLYLASFVHHYVSVRFAHIDSLALAYSSWLQNSSY